MDKKHIINKIKDIYSANAFVSLCGISIEDIECGGVVLDMTIDGNKHTNHSHNAHGGAIAALADTALGVSAATVSKRVVTSSLHVSFIKGLHESSYATVNAKIISNDGKYMVIKGEVLSVGNLIAEFMATMVIVGEYADIPAVW
ncbi:MAG: PaaI family thioesterase [Negativicutes bacterium]|nr:PaaI family thioesterase [Negativicutes bacterium]